MLFNASKLIHSDPFPQWYVLHSACWAVSVEGGMMATNENISPLVMKRIMKELRDLIKDPVDGILVRTCEDRISEIEADIMGPEGTPFEGGKFKMKLYLESDFPQAPPRGVFITRIFHPNISTAGDICVNTLKKDWSPDLGIKHILMVCRHSVIYQRNFELI
jgi:ubiquitin-protein ligase